MLKVTGKNLLKARDLLALAGWTTRDGEMVDRRWAGSWRSNS